MARLEVLDGVAWDGAPVPGERTHALLRALVDAGHRGLSESALVEEVWAGEPPANPTKALQVVVSRARNATCAAAIERTARGYRLALEQDDVDAWALRPLALRLAAERRYAEALPLLERAIGDAPTAGDDLVAALLRAVAAVRGVPAALERYEDYRRHLAESLGVDPSPDLQALHAELLARDRPVRSGVPFDSTSLIGRDHDLAALSALLRGSRVVTVLGPGGLGKTRIARAIARDAEQPVVHLVELVGVTSPDDLIGEVGSALGVRDSVSGRRVLSPQQRADVRARIAQQLDQAPTLLVLDNCEHIVAAVADLVAFLVASTRDLRILTTSRAPLAIGAERVYPLGQLGTYDGVELFCQRATAARPGVQLPAAAVAEIVDRLDGLPLALELAAAKVRVMSVDDISHRLSNRFALLRGGDRSAPDRHQTLLAVIDWSWNLLGDRERRALRWLSVFHDGFTLPAAETMLGPDALDAVEELIDQSLLAVVEVDDGPAAIRYRMLETVREFGRMQLIDAGEEGEARAAHWRWASGYVTIHGHRLYSPEQPEAMDALRAEEANLADVLRQALHEPDPATVVSVFAGLGAFWSIAGDHPRVFALVSAIVEALGDWEPPRSLLEQTRLTLGLALFGATMSSPGDATVLRKMLERVGSDSASPMLGAVLVVLTSFGDTTGGEVRARLDQLIADGGREVRAVAYQFLSHERENSADPEGAVDAAQRALALASPDHGPWATAMIHAQLCGLHAQLGELAQSAKHAAAALPVLERLGAADDVLQTKAAIAMAAISDGRLDEARLLMEEMKDDPGKGTFGSGGAVLSAEGQLALATGDIERGLALYRSAARAMQTVRFPGLDDTAMMPWVVSAEARALATYARYATGADGEDLYDALVAKAEPLLDAQRPLADFPVMGQLFFGSGIWALLRAALPTADAIRLLVLAERFAYNRSIPAMRWEDAVHDAERLAPGVLATITAEYADRRGPALLDEARATVAHIFRP